MYIHSDKLKIVEFEWSELKARLNYKKHGIWFEVAQTVWKDPLAIDFFDLEHSGEEDRFIRCGYSTDNRLLIIAYQEKNDGCLIRIISARRATQNERDQHEKRI